MLERARDAGVGMLLNVGVDFESSRGAAALARKHPEILAAAGVHPRRLRNEDVADIEAMLREEDAVAIGEVGLEYAPDAAPPERQRAFFAACVDLARRLDVGVSLHVVGAHDDALAMLKEAGPVRAAVHYFQGDAALAARYLEAGCLISVGKPVMRLPALKAAIPGIPLDRLLLETDTYPLPGRTTEPKDIADVCRAVAELRGEPLHRVAEATTTNLRRLLGL